MIATKITDEKVKKVQTLKSNFEGINNFIFTDYRGLSVSEITEIRKKLREFGADYRVIKNKFAKIAFNDLEYTISENYLYGPTAIAIIAEDSGPIAKELVSFSKDTSLAIKGGIIDGKQFDAIQLEAFSKLPTRLELIAQLMGTVKAPIRNLASSLNEISTKLVRTLQAIADNKNEKDN